MSCLEPILAVGALVYGIETSWHKQQDLTGPYMQVQTCKSGFGGYGKGTHNWVAGGVQYGFTYQATEQIAFTFQPQGGASYSNTINPKNGVRQVTLFHFGAVVMVSYQRYLVLVEYNHMSRGRGNVVTNEGQDNIGVQAGITF